MIYGVYLLKLRMRKKEMQVARSTSSIIFHIHLSFTLQPDLSEGQQVPPCPKLSLQ
jgi:hypothetical protein